MFNKNDFIDTFVFKSGICISKILLAMSVIVVTPSAFSETLEEAVQYSMISNPEVIVNAAKRAYHPAFDLKSKITDKSGNQDTTQFDKYRASAQPTMPTQHLAEDVVRQYFQVVMQEKLLDYAQINLRYHRTIFLDIKAQQTHLHHHKRVLKLAESRVASAELSRIGAEKNLATAKAHYARVVGRWPNALTWPQIPANSDLPSCVSQAVERGLNNYLTQSALSESNIKNANYHRLTVLTAYVPHVDMGDNDKTYHLKNRSMLQLSDAIRTSWDVWTNAGLILNASRKQAAILRQIRDNKQQQVKEHNGSIQALLDAQKRYYQIQNQTLRDEYNEAIARYRVLNTIGELLPYINRPMPKEVVNDMAMHDKDTSLIADAEKISLPYPDYKPLLTAQLDNNMEIQAREVAGQDSSSVKQMSWYVSAGTFKNKANALALVNRLKNLGFMAFIPDSQKNVAVLVGPYEYRGHAAVGLERLKEIAHVQGVLVTSRQKIFYG